MSPLVPQLRRARPETLQEPPRLLLDAKDVPHQLLQVPALQGQHLLERPRGHLGGDLESAVGREGPLELAHRE